MACAAERVSKRATRVLVDLDAIEENVRIIRRTVTPGTSVMAVVKANAYGHGARMVSEAALDAGAARLGVATLDEALVLRSHGIAAPIQILGPIMAEEIDDAAANRIEVSAGSMEFIGALTNLPANASLGVHLKIDTGMRRFGVMPGEALSAMRQLAAASGVAVAGVFTHFGQADEPEADPTDAQQRQFQGCLEAFRAAGLPTGLVHMANSAGQLRSRAYDGDLVRLGISLYGLPPSADVPLLAGMRSAMTLVSRVQRIITLEPGDGVSYGATFRAPSRMKAALLPVGYADGYVRALSNCGEVRINRRTARVLGRVCMDQMAVEIPEGADVVVDNEATIWGGSGGEEVSLAELSKRAGTIPYEMVAAVSARVPRIYLRSGEPVAVEDLAGLHRIP